MLESNGHFGMVDFGEDWDYPSGSTGSKYPYRYGITTNEGYEQQVIYYLKQLGVEKLDFYIATHAHSDHIGSGDEIIEHFPVDRLYIAEYDDSYQLAAHGKDVTDPYYYEDADEDTLWDNQYVYDRIIQGSARPSCKDHHRSGSRRECRLSQIPNRKYEHQHYELREKKRCGWKYHSGCE